MMRAWYTSLSQKVLPSTEVKAFVCKQKSLHTDLTGDQSQNTNGYEIMQTWSLCSFKYGIKNTLLS